MLRSRYTPYAFLSPYLIIFSVFWLVPILYSFAMSFMNTRSRHWQFDLLVNWGRLFEDELLLQSLKNTFLIILLQVPVMLVLAVFAAVLLNSKTLKFKGLHRFAIFAPVVVAEAAYAVIFRLLFNDNFGFVNGMLAGINVDPIAWTNSSSGAVALIAIGLTWRWTGYNCIIILAGLQNIPKDLYEASELEGASPWQQFTQITLPLLKPAILLCLVLSTFGTLQLFTEPTLLTEGGPGGSTTTVAMYMYSQGFKSFNFGYGSAIAYLIVFLGLALSLLQFKIFGGKPDE